MSARAGALPRGRVDSHLYVEAWNWATWGRRPVGLKLGALGGVPRDPGGGGKGMREENVEVEVVEETTPVPLPSPPPPPDPVPVPAPPTPKWWAPPWMDTRDGRGGVGEVLYRVPTQKLRNARASENTSRRPM